MANIKKYVSIGLLVLVLAISAFAIFGDTDILDQPFTVRNDLQVWQPVYASFDCVEGNEKKVTIDSHTDEGTWYHCNSDESGTYIPEGILPPVQCTYSISDEYIATVYVCDGFTEDRDDLSSEICEKERGVFASATSQQEFYVNAGDSIYINTAKPIGDAELRAEYPAYYLQKEQASNLVQYDASCEISNVPSGWEGEGDYGALSIRPRDPWNVVQRNVLADSTNVVQLSDVANGQLIYIDRVGVYYLIEETAEGTLYVNSAEPYTDSDIECLPQTTGCSDEAKIVPIEEQSCTFKSGTPIGYNAVEGIDNKLCQYQCVDNKVTVTNICVDVPEECPSDKPLWSAEVGECYAASDVTNNFEDATNVLLLVGIFGTIIAIIIGLGQINKKKGGKK